MQNFQDTFAIGKWSFIIGFFNLHECTFNTLIGRLVPAVHPQQVTVTIPTPLEPFLLEIVNTTPKRMKCLFPNLFRKNKYFSTESN